MIDLSDVLNDPELGAQTLTRLAVDLSVDGSGRAKNVETSTTITGIITQDKGAILERSENGAYVSGSIMVTSGYMLADGDVVVWNGRRYNVNTVGDYLNHGFNWAICNPDGV